jgi:FMN phosphatase YigB (HAD superfamily)
MLPIIQLESALHRIRAITLDLDNTLWEIDSVIRRAESQLGHG